jgi:hypothetical protein
VGFYSYKIRQLDRVGIAITGRGPKGVFRHIEKHATFLNLTGFDDYLSQWTKILKRSIKAHILDVCETDGLSSEEIDNIVADLSKNNGDLDSMATQMFVVGFSKKKQRMGIAVFYSYGENEPGVAYPDGSPLFLHMDDMKEFFLNLGRQPKTEVEMVEGIKHSHQVIEKIVREEQPGSEHPVGGGEIHKTTVDKFGRFSIEIVGDIPINRDLVDVVGAIDKKGKLTLYPGWAARKEVAACEYVY